MNSNHKKSFLFLFEMNVSRNLIYSSLDYDVDFFNSEVICAPFGGPICFSSGDKKNLISIYSQNGKLIKKFQWNNDNDKGKILFINFTKNQHLLVITS